MKSDEDDIKVQIWCPSCEDFFARLKLEMIRYKHAEVTWYLRFKKVEFEGQLNIEKLRQQTPSRL